MRHLVAEVGLLDGGNLSSCRGVFNGSRLVKTAVMEGRMGGKEWRNVSRIVCRIISGDDICSRRDERRGQNKRGQSAFPSPFAWRWLPVPTLGRVLACAKANEWWRVAW